MYWKIYKNIIQTNVIQTNVIQSAFWWRTHWILWLNGVFREILSLIFDFQPDLTLACIMCCKMAKHTLKILRCSHVWIFYNIMHERIKADSFQTNFQIISSSLSKGVFNLSSCSFVLNLSQKYNPKDYWCSHQRCFVKLISVLKKLQNSQENTCTRDSFLIKLQSF